MCSLTARGHQQVGTHESFRVKRIFFDGEFICTKLEGCGFYLSNFIFFTLYSRKVSVLAECHDKDFLGRCSMPFN